MGSLVDFVIDTKNSNIFKCIISHDLFHMVLGRGNKVPHEWFFINYLYKYELIKNKNLATEFLMFIAQYYSDYRFRVMIIDENDYHDAVMLEASHHDFQFIKNVQYGFNNDLTNSFFFGDIVTNFFIRYLNYSLIKCQEQKIIITAQDNCHKIFEEQLLEGYTLQRMSKVGYIKMPDELKKLDPFVDGYFYKLPVLPTKDSYFKIDEIIEKENGQYVKILN